MDRQTFFFLLIIMIFLWFPLDNEQAHNSSEQRALDFFHNHTRTLYQELVNTPPWAGYGNITGFQLSYQDHLDGHNASQWPLHKYSEKHPFQHNQKDLILPDSVSSEIEAIGWGQHEALYLLNISGSAEGRWRKLKPVKPVELEIPEYVLKFYEEYTQRRYQEDKQRYESDPGVGGDPPEPPAQAFPNKVGNLTANDGKLWVLVENRDYNRKRTKNDGFATVDDAVVATMRMTLKDDREIESHDVELKGVYYQDTGSLVAVTDLAKFFGPYALPQLALGYDDHGGNKLRSLYGQMLHKRGLVDEGLEELRLAAAALLEQCEMVAYLQLKPLTYSRDELRAIDEELARPHGLPLPDPLPALEIDQMVVYLPDCGLVYVADGPVVGTKYSVQRRQFRHMLAGFLVVVLAQLALYLRQVRRTRTPGQLLAILTKTLYILAYQNLLVVMMFWLLSLVYQDVYLILAGITVLTFICAVMELRFLVAVVTTQINERGISWWNIMRGGSVDRTQDSGASTPGTAPDSPLLPGQPAAQPAPQPEPSPVNEPINVGPAEELALFNLILATGFFFTIVLTFFLTSVITWRVRYRLVFEYIALIATNLYWVPQFFRNTLKNRRQAFSWEFVVGMLVVRLIPVAYVCLYEKNPLHHHFDPMLVTVVGAWLVFQWGLLYLQQRLGPRFWIHESLLPKAYDYQPVLTMADLENGFLLEVLEGIKLGADEPAKAGITNCVCTCPICMTTLTLPIVAEALKALAVSRKEYMITPCHHIFHAECLESWMKYKLQCPVCRQALPPI